MPLHKVLTIDDDKITHKFVDRALKEHFECFGAYDGTEGIEAAKNIMPDVILLDVEMPGINGYEVCDQLKHNECTQDIPVVFLSGRSTLQERMHGYEVGGIDFFIKPFEADTLLARIKALAEYNGNYSELSKEIEDVRKTAQIALTSTADLGQVIQFVEQCFLIKDVEQLGRTMVRVADTMHMNVVINISANDEPHWFSSDGQTTPLEKEVLTMLKDRQQRHNDFGARTVIVFPNIAFMVKNMPLDDPDRYGRIKDLLPAMLSTANGKIDNINTFLILQEQSADVTNTFERVNTKLQDLIEKSNNNRQQVEVILKAMLDELQTKVPYMGLEDDQEEYVLNRIDRSIVEVRETTDQAAQIFSSIHDVLTDLDELAASQRAVSEQVAESSTQHFDDGHDPDANDAQTVELF